VRRPPDQGHDEYEELFGEYPALLTASDLEAPPSEPEATDEAAEEPVGGKRWRFRFRRRRKQGPDEQPAAAADAEPDERPAVASTEPEGAVTVEPPVAERQPDERAEAAAEALQRPRRKRRKHHRRGTWAPQEESGEPAGTRINLMREPEAETPPIESTGDEREVVEEPVVERPGRRREERPARQERIGGRIRAALEVAGQQAELPASQSPASAEAVLEEPNVEEPEARGIDETPAGEKGRWRNWWKELWAGPQGEEEPEARQEPETPEDMYLAQLAHADLLTAERTTEEPERVEPETQEAELRELEEEVEEEVVEEPEPRPIPRSHRELLRPKRTYIRSRVRMVRWLGLLLVAAAIGAVLPQVLPRGSDEDTGDGTLAAPPVPDQRVVAWIVHGGLEGETFLTLLASSERRPLALPIPSNLTITVPGQSLGTLEEAAATGDQTLVQVALQNVLGVPIDAALTTDLGTLAGMVDTVGGVEVADQLLDGEAALAYLHPSEATALPDEPFLRWQDVLEGLMDAVAARPDAAASFPSDIRIGMTAALPEAPDMIALPVVDYGAGVLRVDRDGLEELVKRRFIGTSGADAIRLVVLNGVGTPGIGEQVAQILVPEGFLLVSSQNANTFDLKETRIIASSQEDVPAAERARELMGVGRVYLGHQPGLADVTVVVGSDFGGS
jgi:hypothetical protein